MDGGDPLHADPLRETPDIELLRKFAAGGDETAFRTLYRRHERALFATLLRMVDGRAEETADLVQETWVTAIRRVGTFRGDSEFLTWLLGIAFNKVRESRRRRSRRSPDRGGASLAETDGTGPAARPDHEYLDIRKAIASLPIRSRQTVVLHDLRGHTHTEIAEILGISEGTSKSQLHYARTLLRKRLADYGPASKGNDHENG